MPPMQRLQDLLHRIRWDAEFDKGVFALGYYDRVARQDRVVPFASLRFDPQGRARLTCRTKKTSLDTFRSIASERFTRMVP